VCTWIDSGSSSSTPSIKGSRIWLFSGKMYDRPNIAYSSHHKTLPVILVYREFHRVWQYCSVSLWVPWHFLDSALHHVVTHIVKSRELHHVVLGANFNNGEKTTRKANTNCFLWNTLYDTQGINKRGRDCFARDIMRWDNGSPSSIPWRQ